MSEDIAQAKDFYDARYAQQYMEDWTPDVKLRLWEVVESLGLPSSGSALDYGCGSGAITDVLRHALPGWRITGVDLSDVALAHGRKRFPRIEFMGLDDPALAPGSFGFLFSHHVLEHVPDLDLALDHMVRLLAPGGVMLHVLPSGNPGSLEHALSVLTRDGIDPARGNRFFLDEPGHVRRLSRDDLAGLLARRGYRLAAEHYRYHVHGPMEALTKEGPEAVARAADPSRATGAQAAAELQNLRNLMLQMGASRMHLGGDIYWRYKALEEWRLRRHDPRGSEMTLHFVPACEQR